MQELGKSKLIKVAGIEITVRELTVGAVRGLLESGGSTSIVDQALLDIPLTDLPVFTSLKAEEISDMRPSELHEVVAACKEVNPHFFAMLAKVTKT